MRPRGPAVIAIACAMVLLLAATAQAATLTVTRTDDPASPSCTASNCSLRGAINLANTDGGSDTIVIPAGTYQMTSAGGGSLQVNASMTLAGAGARSTTILPAPAVSAILVNTGDLTVTGLTFANSTETNNGGAIFDNTSNGALTLANDSFTNNGVAGSTDGGAVQDRSAGQLTITASTFSGNKGYNGGALYSGSPTRIVNSTFVNNAGGTTSRNGDAGAFQLNVAATLVNDTITGNECFNGSGCGGAFFASAASIADSIVAGNRSYDPGTHTTSTDNCSGTVTMSGPDLADSSDCTGFLQGSPQLGPLQNNGGPTDTMEPAAGSPVVGAGTNSSCAPADQRGGARPKPGGGNCDIGAVELDSLADTAITGSGAPATVAAGGAVTYHLTVVGNGPDPATLTTVKDLLPAGATLAGVVSSAGSCSGNAPVTCNLGTVAPGGQVTITISATLSHPGTATDVATLISPATDPNTGNDQVTLTTNVTPGASARAPVLSSVSQSHVKWREGHKPASFARKRTPVGTVFSFTLDQPGRVVLSFSHKAKGKCARHGRRKHSRRCTRRLSDGSISAQESSGRHRVSFDGVLRGGKRLRPGRYTVTLVAINGAGKSSAPKTLRFTIVR